MIRKSSYKKILSFFLAFFLALPAYAEQKNESEVPVRETRLARQAEEAGRESMERRKLKSKAKATFDNILKDPNNVDLNFRYAKSQIEDGNFMGAASTLERILLVNPKLTQIRALYAVILFRLDDSTETEREFKTVLKENISPQLKAEIEGYLHQIKRRRRKTHLTLRESVGFGIDTNRNAAPSSKKALAGGTLVNLAPSDVKTRDTSFLNLTGIDLAQDLGFQAGHQLLASFNYYLAEQTVVDSLDISSYQGEIGPAFKSRFVNVTPTFYFNHTLLSRETFLRTRGGGIALDRLLFKKFKLFAVGHLERQNFSDISENTVAHERQGNQLDGTVGVRYQFIPSMALSAAYTFTDKDAKKTYRAYAGHAVTLGHTWLLGKGQFLVNTLEMNRDNYKAPDFTLAAVHRRDKAIRTRTVYGAPLSFFIDEPVRLVSGTGILPRCLKDFVLTFTFEHFRELSTLTNYTYSNSKFSFMLGKRWEF